MSTDEWRHAWGGLSMSVLLTRKWTIVSVTALVVVTAMFFSLKAHPTYVSTASVLVGAQQQQTAQAQPNMATEKDVASSTSVAQLVGRRVRNAGDPRDLLKHLSVDVPVDSNIIDFNYAAGTPRESQQYAQAFANAYLAFRSQQLLQDVAAAQQPLKERMDSLTQRIEAITRRGGSGQTTAGQAQVNVLQAQIAILEQKVADLAAPGNLAGGNILQSASLPQSPARPNHKKDGALALILGLAMGGAAALVRDRLDDRLRGRKDLEGDLGAPVLSVVPLVRGLSPANGLVGRLLPEPPAAESFRRLAVTFAFIATRFKTRTIVITSPQAGEGKSFTTANLGLALARAGKSVLMVSADLHRPTIEEYFGCAAQRGLADLLAGDGAVSSLLCNTELPNLFVLPSGTPRGNPTELIAAADVPKLVHELGEVMDFVLFDTPPLLVVGDAAMVAASCDASLVVADARSTTRASIGEARRELERVNALLLGAVLVGARRQPTSQYAYSLARESTTPADAASVG